MSDRNREKLRRMLAIDGDTERGGMSRREAMKLLGASAGLAGLGACRDAPAQKIVPYVRRPRDVVPGVADSYATSMVIDGFATGLLVESHQGRPTKVEGNPEHPASLGKTGVFEQASVLSLYDPDRATRVRKNRVSASWRAFAREVATGGMSEGLRFVMPPQSSPLHEQLIADITAQRPGAQVVYHTPVSRIEAYRGTAAVYGRPLDHQFKFSRARAVLSLDADFMATMPMSVRWASDYAKRRHLKAPGDDIGHFYMVETVPSPTGSLADHTLPTRGRDIWKVAAQVVAALAEQSGGTPAVPATLIQQITAAAGQRTPWAEAVARDLLRYPGETIVLAGDSQPAATHVLSELANHILGNIGRTVTLTEPALLDPLGENTLETLVADINAGQVDTLIILEANPVYTAPADLDFAGALKKVRRTAHLSMHWNETTAACQWALAAKHYLESWGDARAYDRTVSFVQPLLREPHAARSIAEVLGLFSGRGEATDYDLLRESWRRRRSLRLPFEQWWERHIQRGLIPDTAAQPIQPTATWQGASDALSRAPDHDGGALEIRFPVSHAVYDGRFGNNVWLQELPQPITRLAWGNALLMSPATARSLKLRDSDVVEIEREGRRVRAPILEIPGHADGAVSLALGYGRQGEERVARGVGASAYPLRTTEAKDFATGVTLRATGTTEELALVQRHWDLRDRPIAFAETAAFYRAHPNFTAPHRGPAQSLLPDYRRDGLQWAMTIDTTICTGCSSCVVACQAENNVMVVGREGVRGGREMHWLRIDRYYNKTSTGYEVINQPMLCQHCEKAPCEYVCPVNATVHSPDGLNEMVYNRCIGTRFCSNNCPYKIRRFNWFEYADPSMRKLQRNPDVTVRERGVMEKCTYCVQRIRRTEITANIENRDVRPGEVQTACQQACPTGAIQFGSLSHHDTDMVRWRQQPRHYDCLHELGTRPRTKYLARIINKNPELEK